MKRLVTKISAVVMSAVMCLSAAGCFAENKYSKVENLGAGSKEYSETTLDYGYYALEKESQKQLYKKMEGVINSVAKDADDSGYYPIETVDTGEVSLPSGDIKVAIEAFSCDHPEVFWLSNTYKYYSDSSTTKVYLYSAFSAEKVADMQASLDTAIGKFLDEIPKGLSEFERERKIHDKLIKSCTYASGISNSQDNPNAFTIYGALIDNEAVCEGYTAAMQYLLKAVGIKSATVNGYSKNSRHQWCLVSIEDKWYHLDATWDDRDDDESHIAYMYFNVTDSFITVDHTLAKKYTILSQEELDGANEADGTIMFNLPLPQCNSEDSSFINKAGAVINALDDNDTYDNAVSKLRDAALRKDSCFYVSISPNLDFDKTVKSLFQEYPQEFFQYVADVNRSIDTDYKISDDNLSISASKEHRIVAVNLKYTN